MGKFWYSRKTKNKDSERDPEYKRIDLWKEEKCIFCRIEEEGKVKIDTDISYAGYCGIRNWRELSFVG